ncbi:hypothetical protein PTTG_05258 [Puccinia triticina 1-1 BBBD Race 1]|uniref:Uncharacterized protein n=1 Tax=Puccinia triticina (isolate 1-1 / race 1 (BBBD)) TaxID=630390 RepID=A0A180G0P8_PUCT1|nr:hypothetical protein PTTG_05258 [Puccinia triticina 1-1 BBBD Race 1]
MSLVQVIAAHQEHTIWRDWGTVGSIQSHWLVFKCWFEKAHHSGLVAQPEAINYDSRKAGELMAGPPTIKPKIVSAAEQFDDQATVPKGDAMAKGYFHSYQTNPS